MTDNVKVYPAKASAMNVLHPTAGAPKVEGAEWPNDSFTMRRLSDGSFTEDQKKAWKPPAKAEGDVAKSAPVVAPEAPKADAAGADTVKAK